MHTIFKIIGKIFLWMFVACLLTLSIFTFILINFDSWLIKTYAKNYLQDEMVKNIAIKSEELSFNKSLRSLAINIQLEKINLDLWDQSHISIDKCETSLSVWSFLWQNNKKNSLTCDYIKIEKADFGENTAERKFNVEKIFDIIESIFHDNNRLANINLNEIEIKNLENLEYVKTVRINFANLGQNKKKIFFHTEYIQFDRLQEISSAIVINKEMEKGENFYIYINNFPFKLVGLLRPDLNQETLVFDLNSHINRKDSIVNIAFDIKDLQGKITNKFLHNDDLFIRIDNGNVAGFINSKHILKLNDFQLMMNDIGFGGSACIDFGKSTGSFDIKALHLLHNDEIFRTLPRSLSMQAVDFYKNSILSGFANNLRINFSLTDVTKKSTLKNLKINADISDLTYSSPEINQNIENARGKLEITHEDLQANIEYAELGKSIINDGMVRLTYDKPTVEIAGNSTIDVQNFLQNRIYDRDIKILNEVINDDLIGTAEADFLFKFQNHKLIAQNINVLAKNLTIERPIKDNNLSDINISLNIDNDFTNIQGGTLLERDTNVFFTIQKDNNHDVSVVKINSLIDLKYLKKIDVLKDLKENNIVNFSGIADVDLTIEQFRDHYVLNVNVDTTKADLNVNVINLADPIYKKSFLKIKDLTINNRQIRGDNILFTNEKNNFEIALQYSLDQANYSIRLDNSNKHDQTSLYILWKLQNKILSVNSYAKFIDVEKFDLEILNFKSSQKTLNTVREIHITNNIEKLALKNEVEIQKFSLNADCANKKCQVASIDGDIYDQNTKEVFPIKSNLKDERICLYADNAEIVFRGLDLLRNIQQGKIQLCIKNEIENLHREIKGNIHVRKFKLYKTPLAVKFLSLASLTGPLQALNKQGIIFSYIDIPFIYGNKNFVIDDAFLVTNSFAISGIGAMDFSNNQLDLRGIVFPVYSINKLLVSIPLIGNLLAGDVKKRGVFGMNYNAKGEISAPEFFVNPLTILMPGFLKDVFTQAKECEKQTVKRNSFHTKIRRMHDYSEKYEE